MSVHREWLLRSFPTHLPGLVQRAWRSYPKNWRILADTRHSEQKSIPNIHILHTHDNIVVITQESSIEVHDKLRVGIVHDLQFPDNPTAHLFLGLDMDNLVERSVRLCFNHFTSMVLLTFLAMMVPVAIWRTLLTVPPFPCPRSFKTSKSSLLRSNLYSIPISSCAVCLAFSLLLPPGICRSLSEGATVRGAGAARASPFTFLRFSVRTEPMASDIARICARHSGATRCRGTRWESCSSYSASK